MRAFLLDKKLSLSLYFSDLLKIQKVKNLSIFNGIQQEFQNYEDRQSIKVSLRYSFGNNKIKSKSVNSSNKEEKQRAN